MILGLTDNGGRLLAEVTPTRCSVDGCDNKLRIVGQPRKIKSAANMCKVHYRRVQLTGDPFKSRCSCGCGELVANYANDDAAGVYVGGHEVVGYVHSRPVVECSVAGCGRETRAKGLCGTHYGRKLRSGTIELKVRPRVEPLTKEELRAQTVERKFVRAEKVLESVTSGADCSEISSVEKADLNWLLIKSGQRWCSKCHKIQPISCFAKRKNSDRDSSRNKESLAHIRTSTEDGILGWVNSCRSCTKKSVADWRSKKKHTAVCIVCNNLFQTSRAKAFCCSKKCSQLVGSEAGSAAIKKAAAAKRGDRKCARPDCFIVIQAVNPDRYCSAACLSIVKERASSKGLLRRAIESNDYEAMITEILQKVTVTDGGCWVWQCGTRRWKEKSPYPVVKWSNRTFQLHRLVLEVKHGKPLGSQHAHHICANSMCVNPDHLQPVTHRENIAEMLARSSYEKYIAELQEALRDFDPDHELLNRISLGITA